MSKLKDLTNKKFGRLTSLRVVGSNNGAIWEYQCECGNITKVLAGLLLRGNTKSCGCYREDLRKTQKFNSKHNHRSRIQRGNCSPTYTSWQAMKNRCYNKNDNRYYVYGARGISVCNGWMESFADLLSDMGAAPKGKTLERINVDGRYCKDRSVEA